MRACCSASRRRAARDPLAAGKLATSLPEGVYRFANPPADAGLAALGFLMALYRYDRFKADSPREAAPRRAGGRRRRPDRADRRGGRLRARPRSTRRPTCSVPTRSSRRRRRSPTEFRRSVGMVRGEELDRGQFPAGPRGRAGRGRAAAGRRLHLGAGATRPR